jgi:hypothetical protein
MVPSPEILSATVGVAPRPRPRAGGSGHDTTSTRHPQQADASPRVYVASPLSTYRTPRYDAMVARVRVLFPQAEILPAREVFRSNADWRARWACIMPTLAAVVVFPDTGGWIGAGVWKEVHDARNHGIPVYVLDDAGDVRGWEAIRLMERRPDDWQRTARLDLPPPDPHAPGWFAVLADANPAQAMQTATVVARAGRADSCTVCGDHPAPVYVLEEPPFLSARFCDDCLHIQQALYDLRARRVEGIA